MSEYENLLVAVTSHPDDDAPRLAFAEHIRASEPQRAAFIEKQIASARTRRANRDTVNRFMPVDPLLREHDAQWSRTIAKYARRWEYDRGFITKITIDPYLFLEYGEWLLITAPIRWVVFATPEDGDPFPIEDLAQSSLLSRLDAVGFAAPLADAQRCPLTEHDLETFAASPNLTRLLYMSAGRLEVDPRVYEVLAAQPLTRKALSLQIMDEGFPGQEYADSGRDDFWGRAIYAWTDIQPEGKALEKKYGYIPWLHPEQNNCEPFDAEYYVSHGILPVKEPGSAVV